jgi:ABC-2 type transport system permease protein
MEQHPSRLRSFFEVFRARNREFYRDTGTLAWNFLFPVLIVFGFAFAFSKGSQDLFKVGVHRPTTLSVSASPPAPEFLRTKYIQFVEANDLESLLPKLRRHQYDLVVSLPASKETSYRYWLNESSPKGYLLEKMILAGETPVGAKNWKRETVTGREIRYVDWLISGLLAMNMMFSALFGVGYVIVRYRKTGVLKRLRATPLGALEFLSAQIASRFILIMGSAIVVYAGCNFFVHFEMQGSYGTLFTVLSLGSICLISLGLLVAARIKSEEFAGGILNLLTWPMIFLSGVWFSLEGAHPLLQKAALAFPLTHVISASRAVMTEGATLVQVSPQLWALGLMSAVFLAVGVFTFRWEA